MPTYEYECPSCERRFELFLPISVNTTQPCPNCGSEAHRLIGAGAAILSHGLHGQGAAHDGPACGQLRTCCGRDSRCDSSPCGSE